MTDTRIDGRRAKSATTVSKLVEAWFQIASTGKRPTREGVMALANVSRATVTRLTSMPELAILGTERQLAAKRITDVNGLDAHVTDRATELRAQADVLICVTDDPSVLTRIEAITDELRRCNTVRQRWIEQGR